MGAINMTNDRLRVPVLQRLRFAESLESSSPFLAHFTEAQEPNTSVRCAAAKNPNLGKATQIVMANDSDVYVRRAIFSRPDLSAEILGELGCIDEDAIVRRLVAGHPKTFVSSLILLSSDKDELVRAAVASHPRTPTDLLAEMAVREDVPLNKDKSIQVRYAVAKNPKCPTETAIRLMNDPAGYVAEAARGTDQLYY